MNHLYLITSSQTQGDLPKGFNSCVPIRGVCDIGERHYLNEVGAVVKVGASNNPKRRLNQMQNGNHLRLELKSEWRGMGWMERFVHARICQIQWGKQPERERRQLFTWLKGEWFLGKHLTTYDAVRLVEKSVFDTYCACRMEGYAKGKWVHPVRYFEPDPWEPDSRSYTGAWWDKSIIGVNDPEAALYKI